MVIGGLVQTRKGYGRGWLKEKGVDGMDGEMHACRIGKSISSDLDDVMNVRRDGNARMLKEVLLRVLRCWKWPLSSVYNSFLSIVFIFTIAFRLVDYM